MEFLSPHSLEVCRKKLRKKAPFTPSLITRVLSPFRSELVILDLDDDTNRFHLERLYFYRGSIFRIWTLEGLLYAIEKKRTEVALKFSVQILGFVLLLALFIIAGGFVYAYNHPRREPISLILLALFIAVLANELLVLFQFLRVLRR